MSGLLLEKKKKSSIPPPISAEQTVLSPFPGDEIPKIPPNKVGANNVFACLNGRGRISPPVTTMVQSL